MKIIPVTEDLRENLPSILGAESPSIPFSRMNPLSPPSVWAQMMKTSAMGELVIQFLLPFSIQTLASLSYLIIRESWEVRGERLSYLAVVSICAGSEPWFGSVRPKQPTISPAASRGRYFCLCSSLPAHQVWLYLWLRTGLIDIYQSRRWDTSLGWTARTWPTCSRSPPAPPPWQWDRRRRRTLRGSRSPGWSGPAPPAPPSHSWCPCGRPRSCWPGRPGAWACPGSTGGRCHGPSPPPPWGDTPGWERRGSRTPPCHHQNCSVRVRRLWWSWRGLGPEPAQISTLVQSSSSRNKPE